MAVSPHPSVKPSPPRKPPATSTTAGTVNKMPMGASGQEGVPYGFRHEVRQMDGAKSEFEFGGMDGKPGSQTDKNNPY
jgi:hypothetical protein